MLKKKLGLLVALVVAAAGIAALWSLMPLTAQEQSKVGYIDRDLIVDAYAGEAIQQVIAERDRLQKEFDEKSASLNDVAKEALFSEYEAKLEAYEQEVGIVELISRIDAEIKAAAEAAGVGVVIDSGVVVYGGVDLTREVAKRLGLSE